MEGYTAPISKAALEAVCPTLLVAGEREHARVFNAGLAALMPHATARFAPGLGHAGRSSGANCTSAWLRPGSADEALPVGIEPEPPSPPAVDPVLRPVREGRRADANDRSGGQPGYRRRSLAEVLAAIQRLPGRARDRTGSVDRART